MSDSEKRFRLTAVEPARPISFSGEKCTGCNKCVNVCPIDIMLPSGCKGETPAVAYPDECWYCGCCVMECGFGAITLTHPLMNQARFIEKNKLLHVANRI